MRIKKLGNNYENKNADLLNYDELMIYYSHLKQQLIGLKILNIYKDFIYPINILCYAFSISLSYFYLEI